MISENLAPVCCSDVDKKRRRRSALDEMSPVTHDVAPKRSCFNTTVSTDRDDADSDVAQIHQSENRPALVNRGHREDIMDHKQRRQMLLSPSTPDKGQADSPLLRQLPVVPKPRLPAAIFSSPSLFAPSANPPVPFRNNSILPFPPFCLPPSVDYRTAVPSSTPTLPPPPSPLFGLYHPAFWGALPYLIGRALGSDEQVPEDPVSGLQSRSSADGRLRSPDPGLCESLSRSWESHSVRRRIRNPGSLSPDVGLPSLQDAASSRLEDMAKMVSRLDSVTKIII